MFIAWERTSLLFWYFAKSTSITLVGPQDCYAKGSWHIRTIFLCKGRRYTQIIQPSRSHHWNHQFNTKWLFRHNCIPREIHWNRYICWYWCLNRKQDLFLDPIFPRWLPSDSCARNWQKIQKRFSFNPSISMNWDQHNAIMIKWSEEGNLVRFGVMRHATAFWFLEWIIRGRHYLLSGHKALDFDFESHTLSFVWSIPPFRTGRLIISDYKFRAENSGLEQEPYIEVYRIDLLHLLDIIDDPWVRWRDGEGISKEHRMYGERGED